MAMEPRDVMPLKRGFCDWCGAKCPKTRAYCSPECRVQYNNLTARQGKAVMQQLKVWRLHRGGKGTPGEGMLTQIAARVDAFLEEDRKRKTRLRSKPHSET